MAIYKKWMFLYKWIYKYRRETSPADNKREHPASKLMFAYKMDEFTGLTCPPFLMDKKS